MSRLDDDIERLRSIAEKVLAGTPIESFDLGEYEIHVVVGYCRAVTDQAFAADRSGEGLNPRETMTHE